MTLTLASFTAADSAAVDAAYEVRRDVWAADIPDYPPLCRRRFGAAVSHPMPGSAGRWVLARWDGEPAGLLELRLPDGENSENSHVVINVRPAYRRRGIGRALHAQARRILGELGRKRLAGDSLRTVEGGPERDGAGAAFATAMGARAVLEDVRRRLDVTAVERDRLGRLRAEAEARADGYRLVRWFGDTPQEYVADVAYLEGRLLMDAPLGDLQWQPEQVDADRMRATERALTARGGRRYHVGAVHEASGRMVAWTMLDLTESSPWHAWQQITLVDPDHRGRRLGLLVKADNLLAIMDAEPQLRSIDTFNAESNSHMIAINEAMGFVAVDGATTWEQEL